MRTELLHLIRINSSVAEPEPEPEPEESYNFATIRTGALIFL
jgi:hypothetical protein